MSRPISYDPEHVGGPDHPAIGVTTRRLDTAGLSLDVTERSYGEALLMAGGDPRSLPCPSHAAAPLSLADLGGLLLTGGGDVAPSLYRADPSDQTGGVNEERDAWEIELVHRALEAELPILGICRGCQVINVACGGTLFQHLPAISSQPHLIAQPRDQVAHRIRIRPGSLLAELEDGVSMGVNSIHHQAVHETGRELQATAWAEDGVIEAIEHSSRPVIGVQWHPENLLQLSSHRALFQWLVQAATRNQTAGNFA
jgi:putative glutamine amidotransferase